MSYGLNFLAIDKKEPTLRLRSKPPGYDMRPEIEGIGTNYLPAYTDLVKIRKMYNQKTGNKCFGGRTGITGKPITDRVCSQGSRGFKLLRGLGGAVEACIRPLPRQTDFDRGVEKCKGIYNQARLYEPRDYQAFTQVKQYLEKNGKVGDVYWVGTRKNRNIQNRAVHISDNAPRSFHLLCGKFRIGKATGYKAKRKNCKIKKSDRDCVALKVLGDRKYEFNFYNCKEKKKVLCEVPTDMEKITKRKKKKNKKKTG